MIQKHIIYIFLLLCIFTIKSTLGDTTGSTGTVTEAPTDAPVFCGTLPQTAESNDLWEFNADYCNNYNDDDNLAAEGENCLAVCHNFFGSLVAFSAICNSEGKWEVLGVELTTSTVANYCDPVPTEAPSEDPTGSTSSSSSDSSTSSSYSSDSYYEEPVEAVVVEIALEVTIETEEEAENIKTTIINGLVTTLNNQIDASSGKKHQQQTYRKYYTYEIVEAMVKIDVPIGGESVTVAFIDLEDVEVENEETGEILLTAEDIEIIEELEVDTSDLFVGFIEFWEDEEENTLIEEGFFSEDAAIVAEQRSECWDGTFISPCPEEPDYLADLLQNASEIVWITLAVILLLIFCIVVIIAWHHHEAKHHKFHDIELDPNNLGVAGQYLAPQPQPTIILQPGQQLIQNKDGGITVVQSTPQVIVQQQPQVVGTQQVVTTQQVGVVQQQPQVVGTQQVVQQVVQQPQVVQGQQVVQQVVQQPQVVQQVVQGGQQVVLAAGQPAVQQQVVQGQVVQQQVVQGQVVQQQVVQGQVQGQQQTLYNAAPVPQYVEGGHEQAPALDDEQIHIVIG